MSKLTGQPGSRVFVSCSNARFRWGEDDELGTINYITPDRAGWPRFGTVTAGVAESIGKDLVTKGSLSNAAKRRPFHDLPRSRSDRRAGHGGLEPSWVGDDPCRCGRTFVLREGRQYTTWAAAENVKADGIGRGSIMALADGLVTRGVLLDVAGARSVDFLPSGSGVSAEDIELAEKSTGTRVGRGDAIFIRTGIDLQPPAEHDGDPRTGVLADVVPLASPARGRDLLGRLHRKDAERIRSGTHAAAPGWPGRHGPLHARFPRHRRLQSLLQEKCGRQEFLLAVAPLRIPGGTGSSVNPIVILRCQMRNGHKTAETAQLRNPMRELLDTKPYGSGNVYHAHRSHRGGAGRPGWVRVCGRGV